MEIRQKAAQLKILYTSAQFENQKVAIQFSTHTHAVSEERKTNVDMRVAH